MNEILRMAEYRARLSRQTPVQINYSPSKLVDELRARVQTLELGKSMLQKENADLVYWLEALKKENAQLRKLCDLKRDEKVQVSSIKFNDIVKLVSRKTQIAVTDIVSDRRDTKVTLARHICLYLAKILTGYSLPKLGNLMGGRDHTSVLHAVRKITAVRTVDAVVDKLVAECERELRNS